MPIFKKKEEAPSARDLSEIVLEMVAGNVPEDQIMQSLEATGVSEEEAKRVYAAAKAEYSHFVSSELGKEMDKRLTAERANIKAMIDDEADRIQKDVLLKMDLKIIDQKSYADKQVMSVKDEMQSFKSDIFSFKIQFNSALQKMADDMNALKLKSATRMGMSAAMLLSGAMLAIAGFAFLIPLISPFNINNLIPIGILVVVIVIGGVLAKVGADIFGGAKKREFKEYGLDWMEKENKK